MFIVANMTTHVTSLAEWDGMMIIITMIIILTIGMGGMGWNEDHYHDNHHDHHLDPREVGPVQVLTIAQTAVRGRKAKFSVLQIHHYQTILI